MSKIEPTPEQQAIIDAAVNTEDNLLVSALAGSAKTTTLVMVAHALKKTPILCLAFNRRIALEMQERLSGNCEAMTLNSLGHRVWQDAIGRGCKVDPRKNYSILSALIEPLGRADKTEAFETFAETLKAIEQGKSSGWVPVGYSQPAKRLLDDDEFFASLEEEPSRLQERLIRQATIESLNQSFRGTIDFSDQILMPTVFPARFPQYPLVLIDEAQDLSALNHATLKKLVKKRLIAVGDERQAIYGFRGAHEESMAVLREAFAMRELVLSVSFRCPQDVVREAWWRAPFMKWPDWAKVGKVYKLNHWRSEDLPESATILCRNNAPLFAQSIRLLRAGRRPEIVGNDIGKALVKTLKKLGGPKMSQEAVLTAIDAWQAAKLSKSRVKRKIEDQADCLRVFATQGTDLAGAIAYAEHIMSMKGSILLSTIHKAKGLEFDHVFLLDKQLIKIEEGQEANLLYVAQTRSKDTLTYVESAQWQS